MTLDELNAAPPDLLTRALLPCCDAPRWAGAVVAGRPYADRAALLATADDAARELSPAEVDRALAAHPRIGERARGDEAGAEWSRQEQAGVGPGAATRQALVEGNRTYEARFGRVFLVCATGLSGEQVLAELHRRLRNDRAAEEDEVADELRKIALARLARLVDTHPGTDTDAEAAS